MVIEKCPTPKCHVELLMTAIGTIVKGEWDFPLLVALINPLPPESKISCVNAMMVKGKYFESVELADRVGVLRQIFNYLFVHAIKESKMVISRGTFNRVSPATFSGVVKDAARSGQWEVVELLYRHPSCPLSALATIVEQESCPPDMEKEVSGVIIERLKK